MNRLMKRALTATLGIGAGYSIYQSSFETLKQKMQKVMPFAAAEENEALSKMDPNKLQLLKAQIYIRHGPRVPITSIPGYSSYYPEIEWQCGGSHAIAERMNGHSKQFSFSRIYTRDAQFLLGDCMTGQLTLFGKNFMEDVGVSLKKYVSQLGLVDYDPTRVYLHTTNSLSRRTEESLQRLLMGMFPSYLGSFHIEVIEEGRTNLLMPGSKHCPGLKEIKKQHEKSEFIHKLKKREREPLASVFRESFALPANQTVYVRRLWNTLHLLEIHDKPLPTEIQNLIPDVRDYSAKYYTSKFEQHEGIFSRIGMSPLYEELLLKMEASMQSHLLNLRHHALEIYSCHDTTLLPIQYGLGIAEHEDRMIPLGGHIIFETWIDPSSKTPYIRMLINQKNRTLPNVPHKDGYHTYDDFQRYLRTKIIVDQREWCHRDDMPIFWEPHIKLDTESMEPGDEEGDDDGTNT